VLTQDEEVRTVRGVWMLPDWHYTLHSSMLASVMERSSANTWAAVTNRLSRFMRWEYEYRYDEAEDRATLLEAG
jgi:hypothetical protein